MYRIVGIITYPEHCRRVKHVRQSCPRGLFVNIILFILYMCVYKYLFISNDIFLSVYWRATAAAVVVMGAARVKRRHPMFSNRRDRDASSAIAERRTEKRRPGRFGEYGITALPRVSPSRRRCGRRRRCYQRRREHISCTRGFVAGPCAHASNVAAF